MPYGTSTGTVVPRTSPVRFPLSRDLCPSFFHLTPLNDGSHAASDRTHWSPVPFTKSAMITSGSAEETPARNRRQAGLVPSRLVPMRSQHQRTARQPGRQKPGCMFRSLSKLPGQDPAFHVGVYKQKLFGMTRMRKTFPAASGNSRALCPGGGRISSVTRVTECRPPLQYNDEFSGVHSNS